MKFVPLVLAALLVPSAGRADSLPHTHDGFFLRLSLGFGYESLSMEDDEGTTVDLSGFGGGSSIGIGGMVAQNLAVNADLFASTVVSPTVSQDGEELGEAEDSSVSLVGLGVGVTYWVMPLNLYLAGAIGIGQASISVEGTTFEADWGLAVNALVGKEFWVGDEWGIGVAAQLIWSNVPTEVDTVDASYFAFNILFSATYN